MPYFLLFFLLLSQAKANVVGLDFQNFNPTSNGLDFVSVQSSETLEPGIMNFGYFVNYAVNTLPYFEESETIQNKYNDYLLSGDFNIGVGLSKNWDMGVHFPHLIEQGVNSQDAEHGELVNRGLTEIRLSTKYRFFGDNQKGLAAVLTTDYNLVKDNPYIGEDAGFVGVFELAGDISLNKWALAANIGYRLREQGKQTDPDIEPYGNSFIASLAASYLFSSIDSKIISEIFASYPESGASNRTGREESATEFLLGFKKDWSTYLSTHLGASTELVNGTATPDYRVYAGINWASGPHFFKKKKAKKEAVASQKIDLDLPEKDIENMPDIERIDGGEVYKLTKVLFEFGSPNKAVGAARDNLDAMANRIKEKPFTELVVVGHTDSVGARRYNRKLSIKRAATVASYLIKRHRFPKDKIRVIGYGESKPIADNGNYQGRARNRRVEVIVMEVGRWPGYQSDYGYYEKKDSQQPVTEDAADPVPENELPKVLPPKLPN